MLLNETALGNRYPFLNYASEYLLQHMLMAINVVESVLSTSGFYTRA
jgi:hypothetical protein